MLEVGEGEGGGCDVGGEGGGGVGEVDGVGEGEGGASVVSGRVPLEGSREGHEVHHYWVQWHRGDICVFIKVLQTGINKHPYIMYCMQPLIVHTTHQLQTGSE